MHYIWKQTQLLSLSKKGLCTAYLGRGSLFHWKLLLLLLLLLPFSLVRRGEWPSTRRSRACATNINTHIVYPDCTGYQVHVFISTTNCLPLLLARTDPFCCTETGLLATSSFKHVFFPKEILHVWALAEGAEPLLFTAGVVGSVWLSLLEWFRWTWDVCNELELLAKTAGTGDSREPSLTAYSSKTFAPKSLDDSIRNEKYTNNYN